MPVVTRIRAMLQHHVDKPRSGIFYCLILKSELIPSYEMEKIHSTITESDRWAIKAGYSSRVRVGRGSNKTSLSNIGQGS